MQQTCTKNSNAERDEGNLLMKGNGNQNAKQRSCAILKLKITVFLLTKDQNAEEGATIQFQKMS